MHISRMVLKLALAAAVGLVATAASASISPTGGSDCKNRTSYERFSASVKPNPPGKKVAQKNDSKKPVPTKARNGRS